MKKISIFLIFILLILLVSCLAGPNPSVDIPDGDGQIAGFFTGLWHGITAPITFIISLFTDKVNMYEIFNTGGWYDFGFVLGAGILFGGSGTASKKRKR